MNFTTILFLIGAIALLVLISRIIRMFNKSKTTIEWFFYLIKPIDMSLRFLLILDIQLMLLLASILLVWGVAYGPLSWGATNLTPFWYYFLIGLSFIYFFFWIWLTGHKKFYSPFSLLVKNQDDVSKGNTPEEERSSSNLKWMELILKVGLGFLIPLLIIVGLVLLGITCFAALTGALNDNGNISFVPVIERNGMDHLIEFYAWHFCTLIPQINVAETLNWEVPFKYTDAGVAWLLLLFKSLMAYIVIARFYSWNKWRKESEKK